MFQDDDFDKQFNAVFNGIQRTQKFAAYIIAAWVVVAIAITGLVTWAAIHFISKIW